MILSRFFKPRWQNTNPDTRQQAVHKLEPDDPALAQLAREDQDPAVRRAALERLLDLDLLAERIREEQHPDTCAHARQRYRALLAGTVEGAPAMAQRLTRLEAPLDHDDLLFVLKHAREPDVRLSLLKRIDDPSILVEIATGDPTFEVQNAALANIHNLEHLETVARLSRNRSKRIYRKVQERLELHRQAEQALAEATSLCETLESFVDNPSSHPLDTRYQTLIRQWEALQNPPDPLQTRVDQLRQRMSARQQAANAEQQERRQLNEFLSHALDRLHQKQHLDQEAGELLEQVRQRLADESLSSQASTEREARESLQQRLQDRERLLRRNQERVERLQALISDAERQLRGKKPIQETGLEKLQRRWTALEQPEVEDLAQELQQRWAGFTGRWKQRLQEQAEQRERNLEELQQLVETLEQELTEGEVKQASEHQQRLRSLFRDDQLPPGSRRQWETRVQALNQTLGELRDWRRWGTHQARDHLCEAAEALASEETLLPPELARRIQALRSNWQRLDRNEGAASRAAWERFNSACEKAYQPCIAYFEEQAKERTANLEKRQALCAELEAFHAETDWKAVKDWRSVDRFIQDRYQRWRQLGPVDRATRKAIDKRFNTIRKALDPLLDQQREQDLRRRRELVRQVEALADLEDLHEAINQAKQIQAQWSPTILASRREEQALWKTFRGACDAIFARREAESQAQDQERQENLAQKEALCAELETLSVEEDQLARSRSRIQAIEAQWAAIGPAPSNTHQAIERRLNKALHSFQQRQQELAQEQQQEALKSLWRRHRLCVTLEALLEQTNPEYEAPIRDARQEWGTLPRVKPNLGETIRRRFQRVCQALENPPEADALREELQGNLMAKQGLCLRLEIIAGAETPAEFAGERMAYQVQRLSASLGGTEAPPSEQLEEADSIQEAWCLSGLLPAAQCQALEKRFQAALAISQRSN